MPGALPDWVPCRIAGSRSAGSAGSAGHVMLALYVHMDQIEISRFFTSGLKRASFDGVHVVGAEVGVVGKARVRTVILGAGAAARLICLTRSRRHSSIKALVRSVDRKRGSAKLIFLVIVVAQHFKRIKKRTPHLTLTPSFSFCRKRTQVDCPNMPRCTMKICTVDSVICI